MQKTNIPEMTLDTKVVDEKVKGMRDMIVKCEVTDDITLAEVADKIKGIKMLGKFIRQEMEKYTKPAQEIINNARIKYLPYERECDEAERILKAKATNYMVKVETERAKKEESIAKRVDDGKLKEETGLKKMEELGEEKKTIVTNSGAKLTMKTVKEVVVVDEARIPREYLILDMVKIRKVALAGVEIPGVEVKEVKQMSA